MNWLLIFLGGGLGSVARFGISIALKNLSGEFPIATLLSNVVAALLIGVLYFLGMKSNNPVHWPLFAIGFCGGLSTFSAFSLETFQLFKMGQFSYASLNIALSILLCIFAVWFISRIFPEQAL